MKNARSRWEQGAALAAVLCTMMAASCASIRPVRDVIADEGATGTGEASGEGTGGVTAEGAGADGRVVIASRPPADSSATDSKGGRGEEDAGAPDAGAPDARAPDAGAPDAGASDAAASEAGAPDEGDEGADGTGASADGADGGSAEAPEELPSRPELRDMLARRKKAFDRRCRELLDELEVAGNDATYDQLIDAARALVFNADLRIQYDVVFRFDPSDLPDVETLIAAEDDVSSDLKSDVRSLAKSSRDLADRAKDMRDDDPAARLFSTLGTGLYLWSLGPLEALANGAATTLPRRVKSLAEDHPSFEGASPLRLKGRFASRAPWPYKDIDEGVETMKRAVEIAAIPLNLLFLGDAHWLDDDPEAARDAWRRATRASADEETKAAAPAIREIARMRLIAAGGG